MFIGHNWDNEKDLVEGCIKNDRQAQEFLFRTYAPKMMGVCLRYAKSKEDAQDLLHDGFIRVFTKIHSFKAESSLATWMTRVFVNYALTSLKSGYHKAIHLDIDDNDIKDQSSEEEVSGSNDLFTASVLDELTSEDALALVQSLPPKYSLIINMYVVDGFSHKQIAEALNISEGTSKSQLSRARKMLMSMIEKKSEETNKSINKLKAS